MNSFGTCTLSYRPALGSQDPEINMSISAEAGLTEMLAFFKSYLMAAGYSISFNEELVVEKDKDYYDANGGYPFYFSTGEDKLSFNEDLIKLS